MHSDFVKAIELCDVFNSAADAGNCLRAFCTSDAAGLLEYRRLQPWQRSTVRLFFELLSGECNYSAAMLETLKSLEE